MRKESGKTLREIRRAKKIDEETHDWNFQSSSIADVSQNAHVCCKRCWQRRKLRFYYKSSRNTNSLSCPSPVHDPELFTPEQTQAFKKIGFKNKNYVPVGVRGALFKARFEQALESQKLNIRKTEQQLRRTGIPLQWLASREWRQRSSMQSTKKEGSPYVFHGDKQSERGTSVVNTEETERVDEDSDQEELDRFIAEIEEAADKEWEEEEAAEEEESGRIRYWNREEFAGRNRGPYGGDSSHGFRRNERDTRNQRRSNDSDDSDQLDSEDDVIPKRFDRPTLIFSVVSFSFCGSSERRRE
ncbi:hypothetical protein YC2023_113106 [Brassica napus]